MKDISELFERLYTDSCQNKLTYQELANILITLSPEELDALQAVVNENLADKNKRLDLHLDFFDQLNGEK